MKTLILLQNITNISIESKEIPKNWKLRSVNIRKCRDNPTARKNKNLWNHCRNHEKVNEEKSKQLKKYFQTKLSKSIHSEKEWAHHATGAMPPHRYATPEPSYLAHTMLRCVLQENGAILCEKRLDGTAATSTIAECALPHYRARQTT